MADMGNLALQVSAQDVGFQATLQRTMQQAQTWAGKVAGIIRSVGGALQGGNIFGALAALPAPYGAIAAAANSLVGYVRETGAAIMATERLGQALGATSVGFQALAALAPDADALGVGLFHMSRFVAEAAGGSEQARGALVRLGLSLADLRGLRADDQFLRIADALNQVSSAGDRAVLMQEIFGRGGIQLAGLVARGSEGIAAQRDELERLGVILGRQDLTAIEGMNRAFKDLKNIGQGLANGFAVGMAPWIEGANRIAGSLMRDMVPAIQTGFRWLGDMGQLAASVLVPAFGAIGAALQPALAVARLLYESARRLTQLVTGSLRGGYGAIGSILGVIGRIATTALVAPFRVLALVLDGIAWVVEGLAVAFTKIGEGIQYVANLPGLRQIIQAAGWVAGQVGGLLSRVGQATGLSSGPTSAGRATGGFGPAPSTYLAPLAAPPPQYMQSLMAMLSDNMNRLFELQLGGQQQAQAQQITGQFNQLVAPMEAVEAQLRAMAAAGGWLAASYTASADAIAATIAARRREMQQMLAKAEEQRREIALLDRANRMRQQGDQIAQSLRSPLQVFQDRITELNRMVEGGALSSGAYQGALAQAFSQLQQQYQAPQQGPAALTEGSAAAVSAINRYNRSNEQVDIQQQMRDLLRLANESQSATARHTERIAAGMSELGIVRPGR